MLGKEKQLALASPRTGPWSYVRLLVAGTLCLHVVFVLGLRERIERGYPDFTVFFTAAKTLRAGLGHQLYDLRVQYEVQKKFTGQLPSGSGRYHTSIRRSRH